MRLNGFSKATLSTHSATKKSPAGIYIKSMDLGSGSKVHVPK